MDTLGALLERTWAGWTDAMMLDLDISLVLERVLGPAAAVLVALGATIATMVGRSVVLAVNRLRRGELAFALVVYFGSMMARYALLSLVVWGLGRWFFDSTLPYSDVVWSLLWAMSPLVLGFLTAIPVLGPAFDRAIDMWSLLVLWSIIDELFSTTVVSAGAVAVGSWVVTWLLSLAYGPVLATARDRTWRRLTGRPLYDSSRYVLDQASLDLAGPDPFGRNAVSGAAPGTGTGASPGHPGRPGRDT